MAIDPTATGQSGGPGGWGLSALGTPSVSTMPLRPQAQFTPDQIAQMRKEAMALQAPQTEPIRHWTQGLAEMVRAIQGNREADYARNQEYLSRKTDVDAQLSLAPNPGGSTAPATGAAPAGTLGSGPAGVVPSSADQPAA